MNKEEFAALIKDYGSMCSQTTFEEMEGSPRSYGKAERDKEEAWTDVMKALEDYLNAARRAAWDEGAETQYGILKRLSEYPARNPYREDKS